MSHTNLLFVYFLSPEDHSFPSQHTAPTALVSTTSADSHNQGNAAIGNILGATSSDDTPAATVSEATSSANTVANLIADSTRTIENARLILENGSNSSDASNSTVSVSLQVTSADQNIRASVLTPSADTMSEAQSSSASATISQSSSTPSSQVAHTASQDMMLYRPLTIEELTSRAEEDRPSQERGLRTVINLFDGSMTSDDSWESDSDADISDADGMVIEEFDLLGDPVPHSMQPPRLESADLTRRNEEDRTSQEGMDCTNGNNAETAREDASYSVEIHINNGGYGDDDEWTTDEEGDGREEENDGTEEENDGTEEENDGTEEASDRNRPCRLL